MQEIASGQFRLLSQEGSKHYHISLRGTDPSPSCTCKDWERKHLPCKHIFAIFNHNPTYGFQSFNGQYINSPFLTLDEEVIFPVMTNGDPIDASFPDQTSEHRSESTGQIPPSKRFTKTSTTKCRDLLAQIKSLTYLVNDPSAVEELEGTLEGCLTLMGRAAPKAENGIILEQGAPKMPCARE